MPKIRVMVVDDSAVVRKVLSETLAQDPAIEVAGTAPDPIFAMERMAKRWPDVIVLDVEMPRMDGITFLRKIMSERPTPVVICSTLTEKGAETTMQALAAGAVSFIAKPKIGARQFLLDAANDLIGAVKVAAHANPRLLRPMPHPAQKLSADAIIAPAHAHRAQPALLHAGEKGLVPGFGALAQTTERVVALGTSTGGTQALERVLTALPRVSPGIVIVQHMPEKFTALFAARLDSLCQIEVREAADGDRVIPGRALIAPGGRHMMLHRSGANYYVEVKDGPLVNRHKPSVDVLFRSVAQTAGRNALGVIMTGMGDDGARGLREMREAGAHTVAQDEATCVVYGMPKEAVKLDAAERSLPLESIAQAILEQL